RLVVIGPSVPSPQRVAKQIREKCPDALVLAGVRRPRRPIKWADGQLPLPLSPADLKVRLPELVLLRGLARQVKANRPHLVPQHEPPPPRPGEGILDPLTGFYTFAHFKEVLYVEVKRARRYNFPLSLGLVCFDP